MSEYQHYQFAVDEPLTDGQLAEIRALTTRARLTWHSFVSTYGWGGFKGDAQLLVETHYDAHLYFANWGTRRLILRWPAVALSLDTAQTYCAGDSADSWESGGYVLIALESDNEDDPEDFNDLFGDDGDQDEQWLPSITRARRHVAEGDLRLLYLVWLLCAQGGELDEDDPPGLDDLPEPLTDLATFLRIDEDLIAAAAQRSSRPAPPRAHRSPPTGPGSPPSTRERRTSSWPCSCTAATSSLCTSCAVASRTPRRPPAPLPHADREGATAAFGERYAGFIAAHRTKRALMRDLRAGNPACAALTPED